MVKMMTVLAIMYSKMATESGISIVFPGRLSFGRPVVITENVDVVWGSYIPTSCSVPLLETQQEWRHHDNG